MLGLLEAVLSQTRRTLTKVLRLDTDYTTARAVKIDNLDATVSSRLADADAATRTQTGLTNQGYTTARSPKLDNLDTNVASRMSQTTSPNGNISTDVDDVFGNRGYTPTRASNLDGLAGASVIKSIQRGTTLIVRGTTVNVVLSSVSMGKTFVSLLGGIQTGAGSIDMLAVSLELTSSTNLKVLYAQAGVSTSITISWEVIEYN